MNEVEQEESRAAQAAGEIASVLQATRHMCEVWSSLSSEERTEMARDWARELPRHTGRGAQYILGFLDQRPDLRAAWDRLDAQEQESRVKIFTAILRKYGYE